MSDTYDTSGGNTGPLGFFFPQKDNQAGPPLSYDALQMRRKLAMMLASRQRAYPKTIGEGLTALGEGWADRQFMDRLATEEQRFQQAGDTALRGLPPIPSETGAPPTAAPGPVSSAEPPPEAPPPATLAGDIPPQPSVDAGVGAGAPPVGVTGTGVPVAPQGRVQLAARGDVASDAPPIGRDAIAQSMMQQNGVTPPAPVQMAQGPQPQQPPIPTQIQKAPPAQLQTPAADTALGGPMRPDMTAPRPTPMTDAEVARRTLANRRGIDPATAKQAVEEAEILRSRREALDRQNLEQWKLDKQEAIQERGKRMDFQLKQSTGVGQEAIDKAIGESNKIARPLLEANVATKRVEALLDQGMFTGTLGKAELAAAKAKAALGFAPDPRIAQTEEFTSAVKPITAAARQALAGGANISDKDLAAAEAAAGGNITLDAQSIKNIMGSLQRLQLQTAIYHHGVLGAAAGKEPEQQAKVFGVFGLPMENFVPKPAINELLKNAADPEERRQFNETFKTPGLAEKIIMRQRR